MLAAGDMIRLGDRTLRVTGLIDGPITINNDGFINGVQLIVNDEIYCSLPGDDSYSEIYPTLQDGVDTDAFENWLGNWCRGCPGTHWLFWLQNSTPISRFCCLWGKFFLQLLQLSVFSCSFRKP